MEEALFPLHVLSDASAKITKELYQTQDTMSAKYKTARHTNQPEDAQTVYTPAKANEHSCIMKNIN